MAYRSIGLTTMAEGAKVAAEVLRARRGLLRQEVTRIVAIARNARGSAIGPMSVSGSGMLIGNGRDRL
jgi:hypothetical protein